MIFVCGLPRTGKTTLAKLLKDKIPNSNLLISEAIRNGFQKIDEPHAKEWGTKFSKLRQEIFPVFVKEFASWNEKFTNQITILDCALIRPQQVAEIAGERDIVVCLGFGKRSNEEIFSCIRQFEGEQDYTKTYSNQQLEKIWGNLAEADKVNYDFCQKNGIKYFDTASYRTKTQKEIVKFVIDCLKRNKNI